MTRPVQLPAPGRGAYDRSLSRAERDNAHRERLLRATAEVFARGALSVSAIVAHAGVGKSTFYEFFDSPEHVLRDLEQRSLKQLTGALSTAFDSAPTPLERVRAVLRAWVDELEQQPAEARVVLERREAGQAISPAGVLLHDLLTRVVTSARQGGAGWFNAADDLSLLGAAAAVEAITRRHLLGPKLDDVRRALGELTTKLLR